MMMQGIWILALVLRAGAHDAVIIPLRIFPNYQLCVAYKNDHDVTYGFSGIHTTCTQYSDA